MENELKLIKTCVGLVSDSTLKYIMERAIEVAMDCDIPIEEAIKILLKLTAKSSNEWWHDGDMGEYLSFNYFRDCYGAARYSISILPDSGDHIAYRIDTRKYYKVIYDFDNDEIYYEEIKI